MSEREHNDERLEAELRGMTTWRGASPEVWRTALEADVAPLPAWRRLTTQRVLTRVAAGVLLTLMAGVVVVMSLPRADSGPPAFAADQELVEGKQADAADRSDVYLSRLAPAEKGVVDKYKDLATKAIDRNTIAEANVDQGASEGERYVVRSAALELETGDVRAVFLRLTHLVSEAQGEYVQDSALTGDEAAEMQANVTLRVSAARLGSVLNEVRGLATVVSESVSGEDVTGQYVDLESRLRNEQRVEEELLALLDSQDEAPLKDVLELRRELGNVRGSIEHLQGQMNRLSHLVDLARVLVIVRPMPVEEPAPEPEPEPTLGAFFMERVAGAWRSGLEGLVRTIAAILEALVAGLLWWMIFAVIVIVVVRKLRRPAGMPGRLTT